MTCREITDFLMDHVGGSLPADVAAAFDQHLERCPNCCEFLRQYRDAIAAGRAACEDSKPSEIPDDLVKAIISALTHTP